MTPVGLVIILLISVGKFHDMRRIVITAADQI